MKAAHNWEPGLIVHTSWGYDQTNVEFYEVVELVGKSMVKMERIGAQAAIDGSTGNSMSSMVVPDPEHRTGEFFKSKVSSNSASAKYKQRAWPWSGKPQYCSWYA